MRKMKIVGLDPSLSNLGIAMAVLDLDTMTFEVEDLRVVQTEPEKDKKVRKVVRKNSEDIERAKLLHKGALDATKDVWMAFVEVPVGSQSSRAMASYGICIGILAAVSAVLPMVQVTPNEVKMAGCGIRTATKDEMIEAMVTKHPNAPWPRVKSTGKIVASKAEHMADAIAAIEAGMATDEFRQTISLYKNNPMFANLSLAA